MMIDLPPPLTGNSPQIVWMNRLRAAVQRAFALEAPGTLATVTPFGTHRQSTARRVGSAKPAESGMRFRGEWADLAYAVGDMVVIRDGSNAGTFVCVEAVSAGSGNDPTVPDVGNTYWVCIAPGSTIGQWL